MPSQGDAPPLLARLAAVVSVARYHGVELDPQTAKLHADEAAPSPPVLVAWLQESGLWARGVRLSFKQLLKIGDPAPVILLLDDGGAALLAGRNTEHGVLLLRDPNAPAAAPVAVDELRLKQLWSGGCLLVRASRQGVAEDAPFNLGMIARLVWGEKNILRDVAIGSVTITILSILPILMIMTTINIVVQYHSTNTLTLIVVVLLIALVFEMILTWGRKLLTVILAAKLDARLNLLIFDRLLALPVDFFERNQAGEFELSPELIVNGQLKLLLPLCYPSRKFM